MAPRAVLFDLDGTLHDRETTVRRCIEDQFDRFAGQLALIGKTKFLALFTALDQRGYVSKPVVYERMRLELGLSPALSKALTDDYFLEYPRSCVGFPGMADTLAWLRNRGVKLVIVTNGPASVSATAQSRPLICLANCLTLAA